MTIEKKLLGTNPSGGGAVNVADVFSTYLYTGTGVARDIVNGIDLAGEGGMVWYTYRAGSNPVSHQIHDTERTLGSRLRTYSAGAEAATTDVTGYNSDGFSISGGTEVNYTGNTWASWTFRKAPKFFDMQSMASNSGSHGTTTHSHDLGSVPAMMIVRVLSGGGWFVFHKSMTNGLGGSYILMNSTAASNTLGSAVITATDTQFTFDSTMTDHSLDHIVYLFADNTAEDLDEQMIKCGSFTGNADVTLGWEPQWLLIKEYGAADNWRIYDSMRGMVSDGVDALLSPNTNSAESSGNMLKLTATGFKVVGAGGLSDYIYMAIRAPMMKKPESGTEVFGISQWDGAKWPSNFPVDSFFLRKAAEDAMQAHSRITGNAYLATSSSSAEDASTFSPYRIFDFNDGIWDQNIGSGDYAWMWKRAKGFMDCVAFSGTGANTTQAHSLGAVPEMMWVKARDASYGWMIYHSSLGNGKALQFDTAPSYNRSYWNYTTPTDSVFSLDSTWEVNQSTKKFIAYLFASLAGISKVGSYTGNGSSQTINCGFSAGARFVLIKRTDASGDWYIWDTARGIVAGNDPHLSLNTAAAEVTTVDSIDPHNSGFIVNQVAATNINVSSGTYIYLAIA